MWDAVLTTLREEFVDVTDAAQLTRSAVRLLVAVLLASLIGLERERHGSGAGLRTHMLVALGVALIIVAAQQSGAGASELSRVLQGVLAGIGFLGAGAIIKQSEQAHVKGLTTAASIWATAAIASAAGLGHVITAMLATLLALVILRVLLRLEHRSDGAKRSDIGDDA